MLKTIYLHGELAEEFGSDPIEIDAATPVMITRGLISRFGPKFRKVISEGVFEFLCTKEDKKEYVHDTLTANKVVDCERIDLTPVPEGSGEVGQIILGVVLIAVSFIPGFQWVAPLGWGLVFSGVSQLLAPTPNLQSYEAETPDRRPSFVFNGPVNTYEQGGPVPLVYGRHLVGSIVVSAGFTVEQIRYKDPSQCQLPRNRFDPECEAEWDWEGEIP